MNAKRLFLVLSAGLAVLVVGLIGSTYGVASLLTSKSAVLASNKSQAATLSAQQDGLAKSKRDIAKYAALEAITKSVVPQDKDQAEAVREITNIAAASSVALTNITFTTSTLGTTSAAPAAEVAAPTAPAPAVSSKSLSQLTVVPNIPGVYDLQIVIANNAGNPVTYNQLIAFLRGLENNRRTAEVSSLSILPQSGNPNKITFTLITNDYVKPS